MAWSNTSPPTSPRARNRHSRDPFDPVVRNRGTPVCAPFHRIPAPVSLPSTPPNTLPMPTPPATKLWRIINYDQRAIPKETKDSLYHVLNSTGPAPEPVSPRRFNFEPLDSPKKGEKGRLSHFDFYENSQREQPQQLPQTLSSKPSEGSEVSNRSGSVKSRHGSVKKAHRHIDQQSHKTDATGATDAALNLMMHVDSSDFFDNMFEAETKRQRCKQPLGYSMSCTGVNPLQSGTKKKTKYNVRDGVTSLDECSTKRRLSITVTNEHNEATEDEIVLIGQEMESLHSVDEDARSMTCFSPVRSKRHTSTSSNFAPSMSDTSSHKETSLSDPTTWEVSSSSTRQAINITPNPGYQIMHSSHTDLRQSHQYGQSLRAGKSASDLTTIAHQPGCVNDPSNKYRRRRSSKVGLAYLASRRGSRESVKSQQSTVFSNEDVGPLTFQATQRGMQRRTSNFLELPTPDHARPRVCSLPERPYNPRNSDDLYRLRTFSISKGTVVNCGDSIISRRSRSNTSVNSTNSRASERSPFEGSCCGGGYTAVDSMPPSPSDSEEEPPPPPRYRVVMLGDSGVGKTALVSQFMTSEYMHTYDASLDDEFGEKTVSVLLDGEESELIFIDHPAVEMSVENSLTTYEPHACVIVYSITIQSTFRVAEEILSYLWRENVTRDKSVILVANMADLARSRVIPNTEGKQLAASRDSKFIETSSGIQHNVDELLVGVLKQIRLKESRERRQQQLSQPKMRNSRTQNSLHLVKELLHKICFKDISKSKSCENLHVL